MNQLDSVMTRSDLMLSNIFRFVTGKAILIRRVGGEILGVNSPGKDQLPALHKGLVGKPTSQDR